MVCFMFSLRQPEKLEQFFTESISDLDTARSTIKGYTGVSLLMARGLIRPAYLFKWNLLLIADHLSLIKRFFSQKKKLKLTNTTEFKKVGSGFDSPSNILIYSRLDQLNNLLQKISIWVLHILEKEKEISALQRAMLTDRLIFPLFESLSSVKSQGIRVVTSDNDVELRVKLYSPYQKKKQHNTNL